MADLIQVSKVRNFLRGNNFQIKAEALDAIDENVGRMLDNLIQGTVSEGIKSIGTDDVHRLFRPSSNKKVDVLEDDKPKSCPRCAGIRDEFVKYGRDFQATVGDEAQRMLVRNNL